jgi:hypothetical protein
MSDHEENDMMLTEFLSELDVYGLGSLGEQTSAPFAGAGDLAQDPPVPDTYRPSAAALHSDGAQPRLSRFATPGIHDDLLPCRSRRR